MNHPVEEEDKTLSKNEMYISPLTILLFIVMLMLFGMLLGSGLTYMIGKYFGYSLSETMDTLSPDSGIRKRNFVRISLLANHLILFILPPLVISYTFFKKKWYKFLGWRKLSLDKFLVNAFGGVLLLLVSMPLVQFLYYWNKQIPLPDWARSIDQSTSEAIKHLLVTESSWELFFNIFVIAIIPAIGEEMVFRGVLQRRFEKWLNNYHIAVWVAAAIFSGFHMQLEGFFPRMLLGAILGYLFYWSKSLWIPILVHFANNALTILAMYLYAKDFSKIDIENVEAASIWVAIISLILILGFSHFLIKFNTSSPISSQKEPQNT